MNKVVLHAKFYAYTLLYGPLSQSASATFCSAAHSSSACAICAANLENQSFPRDEM